MATLFTLSYALLAAVLIFETIALQSVLAKVVRLRKLYEEPVRRAEPKTLLTGSRAPDFAARLLGTDKTLTTAQLEGHETILVFVSAHEKSLPAYRNLDTAIHAMWHIVEGYLYVVCHGTQEACGLLADEIRVDRSLVVCDEYGEIAQRYLIDETPVAWRLDEDLKLIRYGRAVAPEEWDSLPGSASNTTQEEKAVVTAGAFPEQPRAAGHAEGKL